MSELVKIGDQSRARRPEWMRVKIRESNVFKDVGRLLGKLELNTVCEEARCPNIWECWGEHKTATFMILGDICTRACRYCSVTSGKPVAPDTREPDNVAQAAKALGLAHVVITSVDRDDLEDAGAGHFVQTIEAVRRALPKARVEVLIPEFRGERVPLNLVVDAAPDVLNHNIETVERLFPRMRSKGDYRRSLELLAWAHAYGDAAARPMITKSGIMVGLGETVDELLVTMDDLRAAGCEVLTIGQYLNPTFKHAPVERFYTPEEFAMLEREARARGFGHVESGPLVRSSYHAHAHR